MTPEELATQTGLSLEEAEMVLERRRIAEMASRIENLAESSDSHAARRLMRAMEALAKAQRKVGVKPYEESK